jgi:hypothetical protein
MKRFLPLILTLATGCSTMQSNPAAPHHLYPPEEFQHNPKVLFVGDNQLSSIFTPEVIAQRPMWVNGGTPAGQGYETSGSVLARMPGLLSAHPSDVVVIMAGNFDMIDPTWDYPCGDHAAPILQTCVNVLEMIALAQQSGSKAVLCTSPFIEAGSAGTPLIDNTLVTPNEEWYYRTLQQGVDNPNLTGWHEDAFADIARAVVDMNWTDDGVLFNAEGAELATEVVEASIIPLQVGGTKRTSNLTRMNQ